MAYCTAADVKVYVGTVVSDADLGYMIADSDAEITQYFAARGGYTPTTTAAKIISVFLTRARVAERFNVTGENPTAYSAGDYSQSGVSDHFGAAKYLREQAYARMAEELGRQQTNYTEASEITRSDADMKDFRLDQSEPPVFFSELT